MAPGKRFLRVRSCRQFQQIDLVPHFNDGHGRGTDVCQNALDMLAQRAGVRGGGIHHMEQQIRLGHLLQGGLEGLHEGCRQIPDEPHSVCKHDVSGALDAHPAHERIQGGEELIGHERTGARWPSQGVEQRGLAGVGVAHQGHGRHPGSAAAPLAALALPVDALQPLTHGLDAHAEHPSVQLDLLFAGAAQANAAPLPVQMRPTARHAGARMIQLRQFDLQLAFPGARPIGEDVQDQFRPRHYPAAKPLLQIALLRWRRVVIDDEEVRLRGPHQAGHFVQLARAGKPARMRMLPAAADGARRMHPGRRHQLLQFPRGVPRWFRGSLRAEGEAEQHGVPASLRSLEKHVIALCSGCGFRPVGLRGATARSAACSGAAWVFHVPSSCLAGGSLTGRSGTMVEMACL